jgi:serine/threonine protein phosphatase PrpC
MITFETALLSSRGGREDNEDYGGYRMSDLGFPVGCWVVADGLGGHAGGALASRTAVEAALASFDADPRVTPDAVAAHIARANQAVLDAQIAQPELKSMRTTAVVLVASPEAAVWAHAGDSRLYCFRDGKIVAQTRDHSVPQRLADAGEIAADQIRFHEDRNRLLRSLGARPDPSPDILAEPIALQPGDAFLLASDGFWEWVIEADMEEDLVSSGNPRNWLDQMESRLARWTTGSTTGGNDNYTALSVWALEHRA